MSFRVKLTLLCIALSMGLTQTTSAEETQLQQSSAVTLSSLTDNVYQRLPAHHNELAQQQKINANSALAQATFADVSTISLNHQNDVVGSNNGMQEWDGTVAMPLWLPNQKQQQYSLSDKMTAELPAYKQKLRLDAAANVRELLWNVIQADNETKQAYQVWQTSQKLERDVAARVKAGEMAGTERLLAVTNALDMHSQYLLKQAELDHALTSYRAITREQNLPINYEEALSDKKVIDQNHPTLNILDQQINTLRTKQDLAQFNGAVNPSLLLGVRHDRGGAQGDQFNTSVGVGISFALDNKVYRNPTIANAAKELADAEIVRQQLERALNIDLFAQQHALETKQQQLKLVTEQDTVTQQYLALQQRAFNLGEIDLVSLLRSQELANKSNYQKKALEVDIKRTIVMINQALGIIL